MTEHAPPPPLRLLSVGNTMICIEGRALFGDTIINKNDRIVSAIPDYHFNKRSGIIIVEPEEGQVGIPHMFAGFTLERTDENPNRYKLHAPSEDPYEGVTYVTMEDVMRKKESTDSDYDGDDES